MTVLGYVRVSVWAYEAPALNAASMPFAGPRDIDGKTAVDRPRVRNTHARADAQGTVIVCVTLGAFELHIVLGESVAEDFAVDRCSDVIDAVGPLRVPYAYVGVWFCAALDLCSN